MIENSYDFFHTKHANSWLSPFELNNEGRSGFALVLRYADCNLRCPLCYAWKYAWFPKKEGTKYSYLQALTKLVSYLEKVDLKKKINWIRIQGGEPFLTPKRTMFTLQISSITLQLLHEKGINNFSNTRAIIQTNGILFSNLGEKHIDKVRSTIEKELGVLTKGRIIFEFSFKDPTGMYKSGNNSLLELQIKGFKNMLEKIVNPLWNEGYDNIALYLVAGLGPSIDLHNIWIVPIDPFHLPEEYPLFHPRTWSHKFLELYMEFIEKTVSVQKTYNDFINNPITEKGRKIPLEELEPSWFQISWIKGYEGKYKEYGLKVGEDIPSVERILRRLSPHIDRQWEALCKIKGGKIIKSRLDVLTSIPVAKKPQELEAYIKEMNGWFYPSHPKKHYPYL